MSTQEQEDESSFKSLFVPFTTLKAIHWIIFIGFVVFANMLFNGFVWDDKTYIINNSQIYIFNPLYFIQQNIFNTAGQYRPIPAFYFALLHAFFGNTQFLYHIVQIILHITNAILLFFVFKKFLNTSLSFFMSLIFLIHPMQVESISYIAASDNPLFFLFGIIALLISMSERISTKKIVGISLLLFLSLITKETGGIFLLLVLLYRFIFSKKEILKFLASGVVVALSYLFVRFVIGKVFFFKITIVPIAKLSLIERLVNVPSVILYYLQTFIYPLHLSIDQQWIITKVSLQSFYLPLTILLIVCLLIACLGTYLWRTNRNMFKIFVFFTIWSLLGLSMHMQLFPLDETVADRWFYLPIAGFLGVIGVSIFLLEYRFKYVKKFIPMILLIVIVFLSARTINRNTNWADAITLYSHDANIQDNFELEQNLAYEYVNVGNYSEALKHYKKSVTLFPNEATLGALGSTYELLGRHQQSLNFFDQSLHSSVFLPIGHSHLLITYVNYGEELLLYGDSRKARTIIKQGLVDYPTSIQLLCELALVENKLGNHSDALRDAERAKILFPSDGTTYIYSQISSNQEIPLAENTGIIGWINQAVSNTALLVK